MTDSDAHRIHRRPPRPTQARVVRDTHELKDTPRQQPKASSQAGFGTFLTVKVARLCVAAISDWGD